jgi:phage shock protein E
MFIRSLAFSLIALAACSKSEPAPAGKTEGAPSATQSSGHVAGPVNKDPAKAKEMIANGATVIDVRTIEEYSGDHLDKSTNIPLDQLPTQLTAIDKLTNGDKNAPVVLHCAKGGRAEKAKAQLEAAGYTNVVNGGGLNDLK